MTGFPGPAAAPSAAEEELSALLEELNAARGVPAGERAGLLERVLAFAGAHPEEAEAELWLPELWEDLAGSYEELGRVDDALDAVGRAIGAGLAGSPDPRSIIAGIQYRAGRREVAEEIWRELRVRDPGDVWLYNAVAMDKTDGGEHKDALRWLDAGLRLALDSGDPERLVGQLSEARAVNLRLLGREGDSLQAEAATFLTGVPAGPGAPVPEVPALVPGPGPVVVAPAGPGVPAPLDRVRMGVAWFPAGEFRRALDRWPDLADPGGPAADAASTAGGRREHRGYCLAIEAHLGELAAQASPARGPAVELVVVPLRVQAVTLWAGERAADPASSATRAAMVTELARTGHGRGWPPAAKGECWCGSGRRYKRCCSGDRPVAG